MVSSILYTEDKQIVNMITDLDYYGRIHQVIESSIR